jgi:hypothetical protein
MLLVGDNAMNYTNRTDKQVLADAMSAIRKMYPFAPTYKSYVRTNWI